VRDRDVLPDAGRAERLAALQHLDEQCVRLLVELEEADELLEDVVLDGALEVEVDRIFGNELA
jgi:hypothetical protein